MSLEQQCLSIITRAGDAFYYQYHFSKFDERTEFLARYTITEQLTAITRNISDRNLAYQKLNWFEQEYQRTQINTAQHPAFKLLRNTSDKTSFSALLDSVKKDIENPDCPSDSHFYEQATNRYKWLTTSLADVNASIHEDLTVILYARELVKHLVTDHHADVNYLPFIKDDQAGKKSTFSVEHQWIVDQANKLERICKPRLEKCKDHSKASSTQTTIYLYLHSSWRLFECEIAKLQKHPSILLSERPLILPIQVLWLVWRSQL